MPILKVFFYLPEFLLFHTLTDLHTEFRVAIFYHIPLYREEDYTFRNL